MKDSLYIIIPAYNEECNIRSVIDEWYQVVLNHDGDGRSRLVIIDDGSNDNTLEIAKEEVTKREYLEVITKENGGHGSSIYFGYQYAIERGADYVFQTDSDGQTLASEFDVFWNSRDRYDVIIGDRKNRGDGLSRRMISWSLRQLISMIFSVSVDDVNTPYRLMNMDSLRHAISYLPKEYNLTNVGLTAVFACMRDGRLGEEHRITMKYIPITFRPRQAGHNSINIPKIAKIGIKAINDLKNINNSLK